MARRLEAAPHGGRALLLPADGGRGGGEAAAGQDSLQQVGGGRLLDVVLEDAVRVAVAADRKVKVVGGPATADHRVELFAGHQLVDESVGGVGGDALGGVNGGGVAELDGLPHVVTGEGDGFAGAQVVRSEFAVGGESSDGPPVAVATQSRPWVRRRSLRRVMIRSPIPARFPLARSASRTGRWPPRLAVGARSLRSAT